MWAVADPQGRGHSLRVPELGGQHRMRGRAYERRMLWTPKCSVKPPQAQSGSVRRRGARIGPTAQ